jgi:hypothetical protein
MQRILKKSGLTRLQQEKFYCKITESEAMVLDITKQLFPIILKLYVLPGYVVNGYFLIEEV